MPPIPRQYLQRPNMPSVGRRQAHVAETRPGVAHEVEAIIAATRGLDLTPIGDSLYRAGSAFSQMERERVDAENELKKMKQQSAARSLIINTTQRIHDAYETIKTRNLSDPEEARNEFQAIVQGQMNEDQELLDQIGPYAFEPYTRHVTESLTTLQPQLTAHSIKLSKSMLEEQLHTQARGVVQMAASIESDEEAGKLGTMMFEGILDAHETLSEPDRLAFSQKFMGDLVAARFRRKWTDNPAGALKFLNAQTGIDSEVRHKIHQEVVSEASAFNAHIENMQQAQDRQDDLLKEDRWTQTMGGITAAIASGDMNKLVEYHNHLTGEGRTAYKPEHATSMMLLISNNLEAGSKKQGKSDKLAAIYQVGMDNRYSTPVYKSWLIDQHNKRNITSEDFIEGMKIAESRESKLGEAHGGLVSGAFKRVEDRLIALSPAMADQTRMTKEERAAMADGKTSMLTDRLRREQAGLLAELQRDMRVSIQGALYHQSPEGNNYEYAARQMNVIEDQIFRQYEGAFKQPGTQPLSYAYTLDNAIKATRDGLMDVNSLLPHIDNHIQRQKDGDGNYDKTKDPVLIRAKEMLEKAKQPAVGASGARDGAPPDIEPAKPVHAGILPDLAPVTPRKVGAMGRDTGEDERFAQNVSKYGIGAQAITEESGGRAWAVGKEQDGTRSYGIYQINESNMGQFMKHLRNVAPAAAAKLPGKPGTTTFNAAWETLGKSGDQAFIDAQQDYATQELYGPAISAFEKEFGIERGNLPAPVHMAIFSTSIQHGKYRKILRAAARKLDQADAASPQELLQAIYEARNEYVQGLDSLSKDWKVELAARYQRELKRGLKLLG